MPHTTGGTELKLTSLWVVPDDMEQFTAIAKSKGLDLSALIRLLIAGYIRRNRFGIERDRK